MVAPHYSVVCPAYNAGATIEATLRSIQAQTHRDFELLVVDDGSTDDTAARVAAFAASDPRIRLLPQANAGTAAARNRGFEEARGELIAMIDNDDLWMPEYLERASRALGANPSAGLCYSDGWWLDDRTRRVFRATLMERKPTRPALLSPAQLEIELLQGNFIPASSVTLTRGAVAGTGGFDPSPLLLGSDDWDLWLRLGHAGFGAIRAPGVLAIWRDRSDSQSKDTVKMARSTVAAARAALDRNRGNEDVTNAAAALIARYEREIEAEQSRTSRALGSGRSALSALKRRALRQRDWRAPPRELALYLARVDPQEDLAPGD